MANMDFDNYSNYLKYGFDNDDPRSFETAKNALHRYVVPIIIAIGLVGNTICFVVFMTSPLKRISTSVYLAALAFSDTGFLICLAVGWLESFRLRLFHTEGICQMTVYASFVFSFTSIWFVNAFTTEMYIAVFHPRKSPRLCTPATARKFVAGLTFIATVIYIYVFWIAKLVDTSFTTPKVCLIVPENAKSGMILACIDTVLTLVVPFTMVIFMITRLLIHITRFYRSNEEQNALASPVPDPTDNKPTTSTLTRNESIISTSHSTQQGYDAQRKFTRMLVVTVIVFLLLNLPSHAIKVQFLIRTHFIDATDFMITETEGLIQEIFQILYYINFSINFLLYSACGKSFRNAMTRTPNCLCSLKCRQLLDCAAIARRGSIDTTLTGGSEDHSSAIQAQQRRNSRLVDIHLSEYSQIPSLESQYIYQSPPCLLAFETEQLSFG